MQTLLSLALLILFTSAAPAIYAKQSAPTLKELLALAKNEPSPEKAISYLRSAAKLANNKSDKMWIYYQIGQTYGEKLHDFYHGYIEMHTSLELGNTNKAVFVYLKKYSDNPDVRFTESHTLTPPANPKTPGMDFSFIVISDTHANTNQSITNYLNLKDKLKKSDMFMLVNGDLIDTALVPTNFLIAKQFYDTVGLPYYTAIGNHDSFFGGWFDYKKTFGKSYYYFKASDILFVCLDTASGFIGDLQMEWLENTLKYREKGPCVVFSHYPPVSQPKYENTNMNDLPKAVKLFEKYKVDWALAGHSHIYNYSQVNGINYLTMPVFYSKYGKYARFTYQDGKLSYELLSVYP